MSNNGATPASPSKPLPMRLLAIRLIQVDGLFLILGASLFLSAGRLDWWEAWIFLAIYYVITLASQIWLLRYDPDLAIERSRIGKDVKLWDKPIVALNLLLTIALFVVIGMDAGRLGWSHLPAVTRLIGLLGFIPAFGLPLWAAYANTFLSGMARIQSDRGHQVVTSGPYRYVRHPMYLGMICYDLSLPLLLGSWWGLFVSSVMIIVVVARTVLEDEALQAELPGYAVYAGETPYRLLPGIW